MRKKQLFAMVLAGALAVSTVPTAAIAEELSAEIIEQSETEPIENTEVPAESAAAEEDSAVNNSTETPSTEIPEETTTEENSQSTADTSESSQESAEIIEVDTAAQTGTGSVHNQTELEAAIAASSGSTTISVAEGFSISSTIVIASDKQISLIAEDSPVTILRADGFTGNMFEVSGVLGIQGSDGELGSSATITIDGSGSQVSSGSILKVNTGGVFGMDATAVLSNNTTTGNGGAINNDGTLILMGGNITGNAASEGGAIYSSGYVSINGSLYINGNTTADGAYANNVALIGSGSLLIVDGELANGSVVGVHSVDGVSGTTILALGPNAGSYTMNQALACVLYDDATIGINESGQLVMPTVTPTLSRVDGPVWTSRTSVSIECVSDLDGWAYAAVADTTDDPNASAPIFDVNTEGQPVTAGVPFTIEVSDITSETAQTLYVLVRGTNNTLSNKRWTALDMNARPAADDTPAVGEDEDIPTVEPTEEPEITETPDPTEEPAVTETPEPSEEPDVTVTPEPSEEPDVTVTPEPSEEPDVTVTPEPSEEPDVTVTPEPSEEPDVTVTPEPSETPDVTPTPALVESDLPRIIDLSQASNTLTVQFTLNNEEQETPEQGDTRWKIHETYFNARTEVQDQESDTRVNTIQVTELDENLFEYTAEEGIPHNQRLSLVVILSQEMYDEELQEWEPMKNEEDQLVKRYVLLHTVNKNPVPTAVPTVTPTAAPTVTPTITPAAGPTATPTPTVSTEPTISPELTEVPTPEETVTPTPEETVTPTPAYRAPIVANIQDSVVTGLENPLQLIPNTFYKFTVYGAGTMNANPIQEPYVEGDTRWVPAYWMMEGGTTHQTSWKIGAPRGINEERTIPIRIYFQKQVYANGQWTVGGEDYITTNVYTAKYNELTVTPGADSTYTDGGGSSGTDSGSDLINTSDATTYDATASTTGSSTTDGAKTGDETPLASMMMLASLSLLSAGYVIVRKRKRV